MHLTNSERNVKRIDRLFLRFAAFYGHVWRSLFKSDEFLTFTKKEWQQGLIDFEDNLLEKAADVCRANQGYPPALPLFIDICKSLKNSVVPTLNEKQVKSSVTAITPEIAEENLRKIKAILRMSHC